MSLHDLAKCIRELTWSEMEEFAAYVEAESVEINAWAERCLEGIKPKSADQSPDQHPEPDADGWIPHDGKSMPVGGDKRVDVRRRDGGEGIGSRAYHWAFGVSNWWLWEGSRETNIIAWRYSK